MNPYLETEEAAPAASANPYLEDGANPYLDEAPGAVEGTANEFQRGLIAGQQQLVAAQRAVAPKGPTLMQSRKAYVAAMSDPRYMEAVNAAGNDPAKLDRVENMLGPKAQLARVRGIYDANRNILDQQISQLESEAAAIPQSEAMKEWSQADNSNWWKVLAKNPVEITAGIMAQSLPAMAPAMAANMAAPGGRVTKAIATGAGSLGTEAANAYLDAARNTGYDFTDPDKVREFFDNPEAQSKARDFAVQRGVPIAIFDGLTAGFAGKFMEPALKQGAKKVITASGKELALQAAGGATGEAAAQITSGQKLSAKDIVAEALGELGSGPQEVISNLRGAGRAGAPAPAAPIRPLDDELPPPPVALPPSEPVPVELASDGNSAPPPATPAPAAAEPSAQVEPVPVPESVRTLQAQFAATLDPATPKAATLVTPGEETGPVPDGLMQMSTDVGVFHYNPQKTSSAALRTAVANKTFGTLLGMSQATKPADPMAVMQTRAADGTPIQEEVIGGKTEIPAAAAAGKAVAPQGTTEIVPAQAVLAERRASRRAETPAVPVTDQHLADAREILSANRSPDIVDELEGQGIGRVQFATADYGDLIQNTREQLSAQMFDKPWNKLRKNQRKAVDKAHRLSTDTGRPADQVLKDLSTNPKYADWSIDDLANALSGATRAEAKAYTAQERDLAQQIAEAEAAPRDKFDDAISSWIEATNPVNLHGKNLNFGVPVWISATTANAVLRVVRATYRGTKNLAHAIQAGIEWLRQQNLPGYNEAEAKDWLTRNLSATPADDDLNFREFADQMAQVPALDPGTTHQLTNLLYTRRTNETDAAFAARIIEAVGGPAAAIEVFSDGANGLPGAVRMFLGQLIIKQLGQAGQHQAAAVFYDERFAAHVTDTAQSLQSLAAFLSLTPEGKVIWAKRKLERATNDLLAPVTPDIEAAQTAMNEANAAGIEAATAAPDVQAAARNAIDAALEQQAQTHGTAIQEAIRKEVLEQLRQAGLITQREMEITLLHLEAPGDTTLEQKFQSAGLTDPKKRAQQILDSYKKRTEGERGKIKQRAKRARNTKVDPASDDSVDAAIRRTMREVRVKLGQIIREHHTKVEATGKTLADKIAAAAGLDPVAAGKLAETIARRFAQLVNERKRAALEKLLKPVTKRGLAQPDLVQKILAATNLGALSAEQFWSAVRKSLKLPAWNAELAASIRSQAEAIERIPEEQIERRQKAQIEMLNTVERAKGIDRLDLGLAFYLTNILTGVTTHAKNLLSTALNTTAALGIEGARAIASGHPSDIILAWTALGEGMRQGGRAAADVLRTGMVTGSRLQKLEPGRALEITQFGQRGGVPVTNRVTKAVLENRLASFLNAWKYNYRLMAAEDLLFFKPAEEAKAALLAKRLARTEGLTGAAAQDRARVILGYGRAALEGAETQAVREGLTGSAAKRRVAEILNASRPEQLREDARVFALRTTFNNEPYGFMGALAHGINLFKASENQKLRLGANLIAPFTNIIANVVNESLNFTPIGFARSFPRGDKLLGRELSKLSPDERADLQAELRARALIGTALLAGVMLKAATHLDDKDPEFAIYAAGPSSDEDRRGWRANGGLPHSLKIGSRYYSYANTPLALPMAWLGNIHDRLRDARVYHNRRAERAGQSLAMTAANAALGMPKVITEQSFLSGIADVAQMISEPDPERASRTGMKMVLRTSSSAAVPNLVRQIDRQFDPKIYEQRNADGILVNAIPFLRSAQGQPMLNALGLPVTNPNAAQFTSPAGTEPLVKFLAETGNWPSTPSRNEIYPRQGRSMTDEEYYNYIRASGQAVMSQLNKFKAQGRLEYRTVNNQRLPLTAPQQAEIISKIISGERARVRGQMGF